MATFSFRPPKRGAKKKAPPEKKILTEDQVSEDNKALTKVIGVKQTNADKERLRRENALSKLKQEDLNQTHFYSVIVFQSWQQKMEFLSQIPQVQAIDDKFIDGETFAAAVGIQITPNELPPIESALNKKFTDLAKIPKK